MTRTFAIGVDLGTTNSVLAYVPLGGEPGPARVLEVPQVTAPGSVEALPRLPSFLYLGLEGEAAGGAYDLPWRTKENRVCGEWARRHSAEAAARTVAAAKSWLCMSRVDRRRPLLPWEAPAEVEKISPVEATRLLLAHLRSAWEHAMPGHPLAEQRVVLTVPASFDASARELTREAALAAGFPEELVLLEEPQAAVYGWLAGQGEAWRKALGEGDLLLVADVGGGTTDFSLIRIEAEAGELVLRRVAVGEHTLLGGDNMDLALAHRAREGFAGRGVAVDPWQSVALWHACRSAKEALLAPGGPESHALVIPGRGSRLVGGTVRAELSRAEALETLLEGFFPRCQAEERPARVRSSGFMEIGLPFAADTAVTRHLAGFLLGHAAAEGPSRPTRVLFNGGVFNAPLLRERLLEVLGSWYPGSAKPLPLPGAADLDQAVARGAAYYGLVKEGRGVRIRGGAPRACYVGIEPSGPAVPGAARPLRALCVLPFGQEEGSELEIPSAEFGLVVGEPARFRFFTSAVRKQDRPGTLLAGWAEGELVETDALETTLPRSAGAAEELLPVRFRSALTELGLFELWCESTLSAERWKLGFSLREEAGGRRP